MAEVRYENATRVYPGSEQPAVDALTLAIRDGELVVMTGPPGCGTTTALRMLAGLEEVDEGTILIDGEDMAGVPSRDRDVAIVFQNYALYPSKTVGENMGFALRMRGIGEEESARRVREAARLLDLEPLLDRTARNLSGGQRQRVALGRAIVREPRVFCMDEPLSNLDAGLRAQTQVQIIELQRRLQVTTVYVTHDQAEAMAMGERVAVLRDGRLQQFAAPAELHDRPANVFVASFIGSPAMNLFEADVEPDGIRLAGVSLRLGDAQRRAVQGHERIVTGIRPEHLSAGDGELALKVAVVEEAGGDAYVYGQLAADPGSNVIVRAGPVHPQPGEVIRAGVDPARLHLFDTASGLRLGDG
ncbi:MAG: multiple sugar transport system ATP-binding protein [Streptosporangiaceae bacterium]|jgi:multiple sugar transport system ATP-binding protein|nr:multiple sugar transport system ATP-binding protein [Streptosporangiaceae bacterium]